MKIVLNLLVMPMSLQVFKSMDKDGSGTITKEEFLKICKNLSKEQVDTDHLPEVIDGKSKSLILTTDKNDSHFGQCFSKVITNERRRTIYIL